MLYFSHRGNLRGQVEGNENCPTTIDLAICENFMVEIDLWRKPNYQSDKGSLGLFLGHDMPEFSIEETWLFNNHKNFLVHAKDLQALSWLNEAGFHCFYNKDDEYTLTSKGYIVVHPKAIPNVNSTNLGYYVKRIILMQPPIEDMTIIPVMDKCYAVCSDNIVLWKERLEQYRNTLENSR